MTLYFECGYVPEENRLRRLAELKLSGVVVAEVEVQWVYIRVCADSR